mmetsp:Transcript_12027/g.33993  ORF Transcript_12027/g.33993 Transcript_12027/m.33993 type:complete len:225 (+) Transcript_12027:713-1387(+)|eukprot:CAMPEP_0182608288 /NCGR_PEP_ID=MMETSP1330-20130603/2761_1 /TAXON_ID=464278 /ORGANISM="Picochlorum sp., Strain RCC944" /LENGTH=224 /DNA_ID=CAMNT_0024827023 /DNA_START=162 /DNA_END=836 /DNA_ORIENTATION=-
MGLKTASASSKSKKGVTFSAALRQTPQADARTVDLAGHQPPIDTLDAALKDLKSLRNLSLSTNTISTIQNIPENVVVLSLGRNAIKRLDGIQAAANSLEQLWISYNVIDSLKHMETMRHLRVLYASNNAISSWEEIDRLAGLEHLHDVLFIGNPLHARYHAKGTTAVDGPATYVREMRKRLVHLKKLDGKLLDSAPDDDGDDNARDDGEHIDACCKSSAVAAVP